MIDINLEIEKYSPDSPLIGGIETGGTLTGGICNNK
jgi:hypothetical protein